MSRETLCEEITARARRSTVPFERVVLVTAVAVIGLVRDDTAMITAVLVTAPTRAPGRALET